MLTRRQATLMLGTTALASIAGMEFFPSVARAADPGAADLAMSGPLGDVWLGSADAKCTIIEYASMTCSHCAAFHRDTWPKLKSTYIDTGKVHFTLREFPLDPLAAAGFMLARCAGDDKYYAMIDLLFDKQNDWAFVKKPVDALAALTKQAGFTQKSFEECLKNQEIRAGVEAVRSRAATILGVDATPTFFINGKKYDGEMTFEAMDKIIAPIVNS
ncbi:MAG: DsbA family protein [Hyphomicrobiales bacterium]|nr:DsbA family protein [Hyphomicrobiales bacterium]MBV8427221.1 DsbA family protein [Hyphomicrobiales bacterium]MBW0003988.1 DsbA family protein [Hyphomicrobiales bacterium]